MASELLKNRALIQKLKEPDVPVVNFGLGDSAIESLIEPDVLPQPKPDELFEERERIRKDRLSDTLLELEPVLMDESVDFIEREEFSKGGFAELTKLLNLLPDGTEVTRDMVQKLIDDNNLDVTVRNYFARPSKDLKEGVTLVKQKSPIKITPEILKEFDDYVKKTDLDIKSIGEKFGYAKKKGKTGLNTSSLLFKEYVKAYGEPEPGRFKEFKLTADKGLGKKILTAYDKKVKQFGPGKYISQIVKEVYGPGVKDFDGARATVRRFLETERGYKGKANIPVGDENLSKDDIRSRERKKKLKPITDTSIEKFMAAPEGSGLQFHHSDATKTSLVTLRNVVYVPSDVNNYIQKYEGPITQRKKEIEKLIKNKPDGYKKQIDTKLKQIRNTITNANIDLDKAGYSAFKNVIEVDTVDPFGKKIKIGGNTALKIGSDIIEEIGLDPDKPLKQYTSEERIKLAKAKDSLLDVSKQNIPDLSKVKPELDLKPISGQKKLTATDSKNIAKKLASFGFKCSAAEGGACDNPMNYLDDIKKQQAIATGSGNAAANAAKKLSAGKAVLREVIGPVALGFELAAAIPITYLGYKAGLPPARIVADATYGLFGETEKARLKKEAVKAGIDTAEIQQALDFEKAYRQAGVTAAQEQDFRGPDDEMLYPQQYEKAFEDLGKEIERFESPEQYKRYGSQLQQVRDYIAKLDADTAAERASKIADAGLGGIDDIIIDEPEEQPILPVFDFQEPSTRMDFSEGSPKDPSRRTFLKFLAGIASLPIVGKFFKGAKTAKVVKLANTTTKMPDWFPAFVDRALEKGIAKKIDADLTEITIPELPDVKMEVRTDGKVYVEGKNAYNEPYQIEYEPPGYEVLDYETGETVRTKGDFTASDTEYRMVGEDDFDVDGVVVDDVDNILGGSSTKLEGFAKGTNKEKYTKGQKAIDEAELAGERADDATLYKDIDPTDFADE